MNNWIQYRRVLSVIVVLLPLTLLFVYTAFRAGPLAPVAINVQKVEIASVQPGLFGIGTVAAQNYYHVGPTRAGRVEKMLVDVGDKVTAGQLLAVMDGVDLSARLQAQQAALSQAKAALKEAEAREAYAQQQLKRYRKLHQTGSASAEQVASRKLELDMSRAAREGALKAIKRLEFDYQALLAQQRELQLLSPTDGVVTARHAIAGDTMMAGQTLAEILDPTSLWLDTRFDQQAAGNLRPGQKAYIVLRSRPRQQLVGYVERIEPLADAVTEEVMAKIRFEPPEDIWVALGELAEVTVMLPEISRVPVIPNAALQHYRSRLGVWQVKGEQLHFVPVEVDARGLDGRVAITAPLKAGDVIVSHSASVLQENSRFRIIEREAVQP